MSELTEACAVLERFCGSISKVVNLTLGNEQIRYVDLLDTYALPHQVYLLLQSGHVGVSKSCTLPPFFYLSAV